MDLRTIDRRFLLPREPDQVLLGRRDAALAPTLALAGVAAGRLSDPSADPPAPGAAAYCRRGEIQAARRAGSHAVIVHGSPSVLVASPRGWTKAAYVVSPGGGMMALADAVVLRHLAREFSGAEDLLGRLRDRVLASPGAPLAATTTVLARGAAVPWVLRQAAAAIGTPGPARWFLHARSGGDAVRIVGYMFPPGADRPTHVAKFHRVPTSRPDAATRPPEESVLALVRGRAPATSDKVVAPQAAVGTRLGTVMVEQAARGVNLAAFLRSRAGAPLPDVVDPVMVWARRFGAQTQTANRPADLEWLPEKIRDRARRDLGTKLQGVPMCYSHQDLACLNVMTDGSDFRVIDWETFTDQGLPLADTTCLATDVLVHRFGPTTRTERIRWALALWRGDLAQSALCRTWVRQAAAEYGLTTEQAEALVVTTWLLVYDGPSRVFGYLGQMAGAWMQDPALGVTWSGLSTNGRRRAGPASR